MSLTIPTIKAIETRYNGYRFRSRLEARWAVYFDAMGFPYEYEKEGFDLEGTRYLPDFWLPQVNMWAEVKPGAFSPEEERKCHLLCWATTHPCLMLDGPPEFRAYYAAELIRPDLGDTEPWSSDYALSNFHGYPSNEHRFYCALGGSEFAAGDFDDMLIGIEAAKSARFEHGESGIANVETPAARLLAEVRSQGGELSIRDDMLGYRLPIRIATNELKERIRREKGQLMALLRVEASRSQ